jgi:hypothetical protein
MKRIITAIIAWAALLPAFEQTAHAQPLPPQPPTSPVIYAAAYVLLAHPPGLGGDVMPAHLKGLGRDCQLPPPRPAPAMRPVQPHSNHLTIRWRGRRHHHRHHRGR